MNEKRIEELLRDSWSPQPPDGMRERVLRKGREALLQERGTRKQRWFNWRFALVGAGLAAVLFTHAADQSTRARLVQISGERPAAVSTVVAQRPLTMGSWRTKGGWLLADTAAVTSMESEGDQLP